jgi:hypothetical protein
LTGKNQTTSDAHTHTRPTRRNLTGTRDATKSASPHSMAAV